MSSAVDFEFVVTTIKALFEYLPVTLLITAISVLCGFMLGLILTVGQLVKNRILNGLSIAFVALMRGTPMLLLILLVYYGLPILVAQWGFDINEWDAKIFAIFAISINISAYFSEAMRSAYLAVGKGQMEAGLSVGMKRNVIIGRIIIPQAAVMALPNMQNQVIAVLKHSALVYAIGVTDIYQKTQMIAGNTFGLKQLEAFIAVTLIYWGLCIIIEGIFGCLERKLEYNISYTGK